MKVRSKQASSQPMSFPHRQNLHMMVHSSSRHFWLLAAVALAMLGGCTQPAATMTAAPAIASTTTIEATESPKVAREIVDAAWMDIDFQRVLKRGVECQDVGLLVATRGYAPGEEVSLVIGAKNGSKEYDTKLYGKVDEDGKVRIRWPTMGCVDHVPTPLLQSMKSRPEPEVAQAAEAAVPTQGKGKSAPRKKPKIKADSKAKTEVSNPLTLPETRPATPLKQ